MSTTALRVVVLLRTVLRRFFAEGLDQSGASLAYLTLFSLVPMVVIAFGVMSLLPGIEAYALQLDRFLAGSVLPERSGGMIVDYVLTFSRNASEMTLFGLAGLCLSVLFLLLNMERAFNDIWRVSGRSVWWRRLGVYVGVLAFWPLAVVGVGYITYQAVVVSLGWFEQPGWMRVLSLRLGGLLATAFCFTLLYVWLPNAKVRFCDAGRGGFFAALAFLGMQKGFAAYIGLVPTFSLLYGAFAVVPIFLFWLYLSWCLVLLGGLVAAEWPRHW